MLIDGLYWDIRGGNIISQLYKRQTGQQSPKIIETSYLSLRLAKLFFSEPDDYAQFKIVCLLIILLSYQTYFGVKSSEIILQILAKCDTDYPLSVIELTRTYIKEIEKTVDSEYIHGCPRYFIIVELYDELCL